MCSLVMFSQAMAPFSARNRPMLPDPLHRGVCPFELHLSVPSVCDWAVGVRVLVRGCSLCRVRDPVCVAWCGCGARASCSVEAEPGACTGYSAHDSAIQLNRLQSVRQSCVSTFQGLMGVHTGASPIYGSLSFP